ncbi:MAG: DUF1445 domain-containing protein, partial [Alphaproteobacteria bacterium]|nr:DUF1445 domain-containing protein [Alphaproteobacteria bacterium]
MPPPAQRGEAGTLTPAQAARAEMRAGRFTGITRGLALGYVQCAVVILPQRYAYDFLLFCQRNSRACPVLEVIDAGETEARRSAPGSDLRTDIPKYSIYRNGAHVEDVTDIRHLWRDDFVSFLIGSGITFDQALERAGVPTTRNRWVLNTSTPTDPAGIFRGGLVVTMRWLTPEQAITAVQVTSRFPFNHGAPVHVGDPAVLGCDLAKPLVGPPVERVPPDLTALFWACSVTPQAVALAAKVELMITQAPSCGFIIDV